MATQTTTKGSSRVSRCTVALVFALSACASDALNIGNHAHHTRLASGKTSARGVANPWADILERYNVPLVHGSGVYVDLGNTKTLSNKKYREPGGKCPNYGKYIQTYQPTTNPDIWPNDFLRPVPYANTPQDTKPLGGGFAMPMKQISPVSLKELKEQVESLKAGNGVSSYAVEHAKKIRDDLGHCIFWARMTSAHDASSSATNSKEDYYRYAFAWDPKNEMCHIMYLNMQEMTGAGTHCKRGDSGPNLSWYCFQPQKSIEKNLVWGSAYARPDHASACPEHGLVNVHWGQWNGRTCQKMAVRKRISVGSATECALELFKNSPSDNPTQYVGDEGRGWDKILDDVVGVLIPAGSTKKDQPHTRGVGINWANFYRKSSGSYCEMYDGVPNCLTSAPDQYAFVSLGDPNPDNAQLPPCSSTTEGIVIPSQCSCPEGATSGTTTGVKCEDGKWVDGSVSCTCSLDEDTSVNIWLIAGPCIAAGVLLLGGLIYWMAQRNKREPAVEKPQIVDETREHAVRTRQNQADLLQEAEPSFWGEADNYGTSVILDSSTIDKDF
ncbi:UNVERIFIED_CONTAM: apical membrane antigen 1 domain-containing protein [Hammondia hammondi]|eukprot:XP_008888398.1 apical membrane antigen 1 domain-containing protein [Hammondia hammondi]